MPPAIGLPIPPMLLGAGVDREPSMHGMGSALQGGSGPAKAVLAYLADRASDDGTGAYPKVRTICEATEFSERTVRSALKLLEERGSSVRAISGMPPWDGEAVPGPSSTAPRCGTCALSGTPRCWPICGAPIGKRVSRRKGRHHQRISRGSHSGVQLPHLFINRQVTTTMTPCSFGTFPRSRIWHGTRWLTGAIRPRPDRLHTLPASRAGPAGPPGRCPSHEEGDQRSRRSARQAWRTGHAGPGPMGSGQI